MNKILTSDCVIRHDLKVNNLFLKYFMKIKNIFLISLLLLTLTIIFTYPAIFHLKDMIIGDGNDSSLIIGWQYLAGIQVEKGIWPFSWTNYWRYPVGFDFSMGYDSILFIILGILLNLYSTNDVLIFNLSVLILVFFNGVFSYLFFRKISNNFVLGVLGAIIYGFSFYVLARLGGHMNLIFVGSFPLFAYGLIFFKENHGNLRAFILLTVSAILIFFSSLQYFLIFIVGVILALPLYIYFFPSTFYTYFNLFGKNLLKSLLAVFFFLLIFLVFYKNHVLAFFGGNLITLPKDYMSSVSPFILNFYIPNSYMRIFINNFLKTTTILGIEGSIFLGYTELTLFLFFLLSRVDKKVKKFILSSTLIFFILSLGCSLPFQPYCYLYKFFPFRGITETSRFYVLLYFFITTGIVLALNKINKNTKTQFVMLLIIILIFVERIPSNFYISTVPFNKEFIKIAKVQSSNAILDLPIINQWTPTTQKTRYDLYSIYYEKPIVGGSLQWLANNPSSESFVGHFSQLTCGTQEYIRDIDISQNFLPLLRKSNINTIVFHKNLADFGDGSDYCDIALINIRYFIFNSNLTLKKVYEDDSETVIQLK